MKRQKLLDSFLEQIQIRFWDSRQIQPGDFGWCFAAVHLCPVQTESRLSGGLWPGWMSSRAGFESVEPFREYEEQQALACIEAGGKNEQKHH